MAGWSTATGRALVRFQVVALSLTRAAELGIAFPRWAKYALKTFTAVAANDFARKQAIYLGRPSFPQNEAGAGHNFGLMA
jgi:hypothetical protein